MVEIKNEIEVKKDVTDITKKLGLVLKSRRERLLLNQRQVSRLIGVSRGTYQRWESGTGSPLLMYLPRIGEALGFDVTIHLEAKKEAEPNLPVGAF